MQFCLCSSSQVLFVVVSNNPQNVVAATFEGLKSLRGPAEVARIRGKSVEEIVG